MKRTFLLTAALILTLLPFAGIAQKSLTMYSKPTMDWEHNFPTNEVLNLYCDRPLQIKGFAEEFEEAPEIKYQLIADDSTVSIKPHPVRKNWFIVQAQNPGTKVRLSLYAYTDEAFIYRFPYNKETNRILSKEEYRTTSKSKVAWKKNPIGPEGILLDAWRMDVREKYVRRGS